MANKTPSSLDFPLPEASPDLEQLLKKQYVHSDQDISPPSKENIPPRVPSPAPYSTSHPAFGHSTPQRTPSCPPKHNSLLENLSPTQIAISHPLETTHGYGRLRHLDRMKREQFVKNAHAPAAVRWDEKDLTSIIDVLESCGEPRHRRPCTNPRTAVATPSAPDSYNSQNKDAAKFDPRAPHFDVILVDLTNALAEPRQSEESAALDAADECARGQNCKYRRGGFQHQRFARCGADEAVRVGAKKISPFRSDINDLPMESLAGRPGWLFLWVGRTENLIEGRRILGKWGFRKIECVGWVKASGGWDKVKTSPEEELQNPSEMESEGMFRRGIEWCLVGVKGTAKRSYDSHLIHCNIGTDVIVSDTLDAPKSTLLSKVIESFSQGNRRLHLFANPGDERAGWVTVGKHFEETTFNCRKYMRSWEEKGKHGWLAEFDAEIEYFRPKTPPLQVRKRERAELRKNSRSGGNPSRGRVGGDDELPKFPHLGQRKLPILRYLNEAEDPENKKRFHAVSTPNSKGPPPNYGMLPKISTGSRVSQLSGVSPIELDQRRNGPQMRFKRPGLSNQFRPSPTTEKLHSEELAKTPTPAVTEMGSQALNTAVPPGFERYEAPSISSTVSSSPSEGVYPYLQQSRPSSLSSSYPITEPSSLGSRFEGLSMQSQTASRHLRPPKQCGSTQSGFRPENRLQRKPGTIENVNQARFPTSDGFRAEPHISQQPTALFGAYGDISALGLNKNQSLYPGTGPQQDHQPSIQKPSTGLYLNQYGQPAPHGHIVPQNSQYTHIVGQLDQLERQRQLLQQQQHQHQWQWQIYGRQYPVPGFQQHQLQPQGPYGAYGFQHQNQQPQVSLYGGYGFQSQIPYDHIFQEQEFHLLKAQYDQMVPAPPPNGTQQYH